MITRLLLATTAATGVALLAWTPHLHLPTGRRTRSVDRGRSRSGHARGRTRAIVLASAVAAGVGAVGGLVLLGGPVAGLLGAVGGATLPVAQLRAARSATRSLVTDAWPAIIEQLRVETQTLGRSIPLAVVDLAETAPAPLRPVFESARRTWRLTGDLAATLAVVREGFAEPGVDMTCEVLLLAHELGGPSLDGRLRDLAEDRRTELAHRREARSRQAGVRLARNLVLVVPLGMAAAGSLIGTGRSAYSSPGGQLVVAVAAVLVAGCWAWSSRYLRMPSPPRLFNGEVGT